MLETLYLWYFLYRIVPWGTKAGFWDREDVVDVTRNERAPTGELQAGRATSAHRQTNET